MDVDNLCVIVNSTFDSYNLKGFFVSNLTGSKGIFVIKKKKYISYNFFLSCKEGIDFVYIKFYFKSIIKLFMKKLKNIFFKCTLKKVSISLQKKKKKELKNRQKNFAEIPLKNVLLRKSI